MFLLKKFELMVSINQTAMEYKLLSDLFCNGTKITEESRTARKPAMCSVAVGRKVPWKFLKFRTHVGGL